MTNRHTDEGIEAVCCILDLSSSSVLIYIYKTGKNVTPSPKEGEKGGERNS